MSEELNETLHQVAKAVEGKNTDMAMAVLLEVTVHVIKANGKDTPRMAQAYLKRFAESMNEDD